MNKNKKAKPDVRYKLLPSLEKKEPPEAKVCITCHIEKPIGEFAKCKSYADGHRSTCKECVNEVRRQMEELNKSIFPF
jgi:hypothetical protein